jgi:hypothetical protein
MTSRIGDSATATAREPDITTTAGAAKEPT